MFVWIVIKLEEEDTLALKIVVKNAHIVDPQKLGN